MTANSTNKTVPQPLFAFRFTDNDTDPAAPKSTSSVNLQGNEAIYENSPTIDLNSLTLSAWVRPDYSAGSSVFTVISDTNAFILAVNNNMPVAKAATFSIFDGIKWTTVQSSSLIPEQWTHLAATYNGTAIAIYVNGSLEKTTQVASIPVVIDGHLTTKAGQNITSDANVTIGAYYEKVRAKTSDLFSGDISGVNLYGVALTQEQIERTFANARPTTNLAYPDHATYPLDLKPGT